VSPPEYGLINSNKQSTSSGYPLNTSLEFACVQGYRLQGTRVHVCSLNGTWTGERVTCTLIETTTNRFSSHTSSSIKNTLEQQQQQQQQQQHQQPTQRSRHEACKIDTSSIIISYANSINTNYVQSVNDFVFQNVTIGDFIEHGTMASYYCKANNFIAYSAKCINGTLLMEQNCNELTKCKIKEL
jgi:hypothetical protein